MKKNLSSFIITSLVFIEWFEYSIYLYLGAVIAESLFPGNAQQSLVFVYLIFAISYLSRPLGGTIFGFMSDTTGRKPTLIASGYIMTISTIGIAFIPSYASIGYFAPLLLLLLRFTQGLAAGGEFNNSSILLMESNPKNKTISGSWTGFSSSAGMFMGALVSLMMSKVFNPHESWRFAYYIAAAVSLVILFARHKIMESPAYSTPIPTSQKNRLTVNLFKTLGNYKSSLFKIFVASAFMSIYIYTCMIYFMSYYKTVNTANQFNPMVISMTAQFFVTLCIPFMAVLAEKLNYKSVFKACILIVCIAAPTLFISAQKNSFTGVTAGIILYVIGNSGISAIMFRYMFYLLPAHIRCLGTSMAWGFAAAILGATAPIISQYFVSQNHLQFPWLYIISIGAIFYIIVTKTKSKEIYVQTASHSNLM
ncbi:MFS transporter [Facilibium subflavum]|uniref:MFS transporter n=1 Tax=Facilibium subflavum TaxID=2219058 RepID=UPI000E65CBBB|nr:MFS transporter [Facilibium subflavum]